MDTIRAIMERRSCRDFTSQPVTKKSIRQILDAARYTPSAMNNQPWEFTVVAVV